MGSESKRARLDSWSGASHRVQHVAETPTRYANNIHPPPTSAQNTYHEAEQRELPDPVSHPPAHASSESYHVHESTSQSQPYNHHSGYATPAHSVSASFPIDHTYPRSGGTPMKSRSPTEPVPHPPNRPVSITSSNGPPPLSMPYSSDHPPPSAPASSSPFHSHQANGSQHNHPMASQDAMASAHPVSYAASPISTGPRDSFYVGSSAVSEGLLMTYPPRRKAIRAAQVCLTPAQSPSSRHLSFSRQVGQAVPPTDLALS